MGHGIEALLASAATASLAAAHYANERKPNRWRSVLLESLEGGLVAEHDQEQQEEPEQLQASHTTAVAQHWMQSLLINLSGQQTGCAAAAALNIQWQRHMRRVLPLAAAAALNSATSSRSCSAGGCLTHATVALPIRAPSYCGSVSCPGSISSAAAETGSAVLTAARLSSRSSTCSTKSRILSSAGCQWELLPSAASSIEAGQLASVSLPAEVSEAAHLLAPGTGAPSWSTSESAATEVHAAGEAVQLADTFEAATGAPADASSDADVPQSPQQQEQQQQQQQQEQEQEQEQELQVIPHPADSDVQSMPETSKEQRWQHSLSFTLQCSSEQPSTPDRCIEEQEASSSSGSSSSSGCSWVAEVPQQEGPCTSLLTCSSRSSTADVGLQTATTEDTRSRSSSSSAGSSIDMFHGLRTVAGASRQEGLAVPGVEASSSGVGTAELQQLQQQQQEQLLQLLPLLQQLQRLEGLAGSLDQAEVLSAAVLQHCGSLTSQNSQLRSKEALARAQARQLAVRHDACLSKLMQAQQQLEQQRLQLKASQRAASERLQQLLQLLQAKQQQAVVCRTVSEDTGSNAQQQQQQQQEQQVAGEDAQQVADAETQQQHGLQQQQNGNKPVSMAEQQQQQQPVPTAEQEEEGETGFGVNWLWQLMSQLESSTLEVLDSREQDIAPLQQLQQQVQQLTLELHAATKAAEASAAEKQQLQRARDTMSLKLADSQRQLLQKHHDLTAVTNDRIVIAAGKTKMHHQLQDMQLQQQELELAGQQALEAAELNAQRADQLQQQVGVLQAALSAAESAKQKSDQELKLAQSECENGLHQVAQLQLELQSSKMQHAKALQELQQQLAAASEQRQQLQRQLDAAAAAKGEQDCKLGEQLKQLQQKLLAAGAAEGSSRQQVLQLQQQLEAAKSVNGKALQDTQQLQQKLQAAAADKQRLQQQLAAAQAECITAQQQLVQVHADAAQMKQQLEAAEASSAEVQQQLQAVQQEVKAMHDNADLENNQLIEALRAAQARIAGSTQQVVEAQLDVTQLAQVVELQQQQLLWQQDVIRKLRSAVPRAQLQLLLPDLDACSSICTSPALSPGPGTAPHSRVATPSRPMSPLVLARPISPYKQQQQQQQQQEQHETMSMRAGTHDAANSAASAATAADRQVSLQLPSFLMPQLTDDGAATCAAGNPLFAHPMAAAVQQLPASNLWGTDTADTNCTIRRSSDDGNGLQAVTLPASLEEQASSIVSMPRVPRLPVDEGNAAHSGAAYSGSSSSKGSALYGQRGVQQQQQQQQQHQNGDKGTQRNGKRNSMRISANGSSVVLTRNKSQGNAKNRRGAAGATAAAVAAAADSRRTLVPAVSAMVCDSSSSVGAGAGAAAAAAEFSSSGVGGGFGDPAADGPGSWLWLQAPAN